MLQKNPCNNAVHFTESNKKAFSDLSLPVSEAGQVVNSSIASIVF